MSRCARSQFLQDVQEARRGLFIRESFEGNRGGQMWRVRTEPDGE